MYKAILCYDGTSYLGWQKTSYGPSIQEELEKAIFQLSGEKVIPEAASRTDRGVHAEGQVVQFALKNEIPCEKFMRGLNALLPKDIRVINLSFASFHPTLDAIAKEYHYRICLGSVQDPLSRLYAWHVHYPLNFEKMEESASKFLGTHDFSAFANEQKENPMCTIEKISFISLPHNHFEIRIRGDRFLYKMVRNMAGSLIYVGRGKPLCIETILKSRDRKLAGVTAPAQGLYLHQVFYKVK